MGCGSGQYQEQQLIDARKETKKARLEERAKAKEKLANAKRAIVRNLIGEFDDDDAIVRIADVSLKFVQEVRSNLKENK